MKILAALAFLGLSLLFGDDVVGKISSLKGIVEIQRGEEQKEGFIGFEIKSKDTVSTKADSFVKIDFIDSTQVTIGTNSSMKIAQYIQEQGKTPEAEFSFLKGTFKAITGGIGKISPKSFKLTTNNATIGIRGTTILGQTSSAEDKISCLEGSIKVYNQKGSVNLMEGQSTTVKKDKAPSSAQILTIQDQNKMEQSIASAQNGDSKGSNVNADISNEAKIIGITNIAIGSNNKATVGSITIE